MAKENLSNYSVSKETTMMLDALKMMDQAWDLVTDALCVKHGINDDSEKMNSYRESFDEAFDKAKEFVIAEIEDNLRNHICILNFKEI